MGTRDRPGRGGGGKKEEHYYIVKLDHKFAIVFENVDHLYLFSVPKAIFVSSNYHYAAYCQYVWWIYGKLGRKRRKVIPACVVVAIQKEFPNVRSRLIFSFRSARILEQKRGCLQSERLTAITPVLIKLLNKILKFSLGAGQIDNWIVCKDFNHC